MRLENVPQVSPVLKREQENDCQSWDRPKKIKIFSNHSFISTHVNVLVIPSQVTVNKCQYYSQYTLYIIIFRLRNLPDVFGCNRPCKPWVFSYISTAINLWYRDSLRHRRLNERIRNWNRNLTLYTGNWTKVLHWLRNVKTIVQIRKNLTDKLIKGIL